MGKRLEDLTPLQTALDYTFQDEALLARALTHPSSRKAVSNQRLEFLGDRVLGLSISAELFARHPNDDEGALAPRFNALVRKETCAKVAERIALGAYLHLGKSEAQSGGRRKAALLADAMEAVLAAIMLDGGFEPARNSVLTLWEAELEAQDVDAPVDAKTGLQEWAQARGLTPPSYVETARSGPDHAPRFTIEARLSTGETAEATAGSKRTAQQHAAESLLRQVKDTE